MDTLKQALEQAHDIYHQTLDQTGNADEALGAARDSMRESGAANDVPLSDVETVINDPIFSNSIANQNPQNILETISTVMDESAEVPAAESVVDANPSLNGDYITHGSNTFTCLTDDHNDDVEHTADTIDQYGRPIAGLVDNNVNEGENLHAQNADLTFSCNGWYDPDASTNYFGDNDDIVGNNIINMDIAAVDGNGEVISANPYISTSTEKDTVAGDDTDLGFNCPNSELGLISEDVTCGITSAQGEQDPYCTDPENDDLAHADHALADHADHLAQNINNAAGELHTQNAGLGASGAGAENHNNEQVDAADIA